MPTTTFDGRRFHWHDAGGGDQALLLLHAFPFDSAMWQPQADAFADRCRVIAPDLAGFGGSDAPGRGTHVVETWADDVVSLLSLLDPGPVVLAGASLGADVALAVTRRHREAVGALALLGPLGAAPMPDVEATWTAARDRAAAGDDTGPVLDRLLGSMVGEDSPMRDEVTKLARWMAGRTSREGWWAGFEALAHRPDPLGDLDKIDVPALVLVGEDDRFASPADARRLAGGIPGAGVIEVASAGHLVNLESPAAVVGALDDLLAGRVARAPGGKHSWPASPAGTRTG